MSKMKSFSRCRNESYKISKKRAKVIENHEISHILCNGIQKPWVSLNQPHRLYKGMNLDFHKRTRDKSIDLPRKDKRNYEKAEYEERNEL